jgi:hypothetical protein
LRGESEVGMGLQGSNVDVCDGGGEIIVEQLGGVVGCYCIALYDKFSYQFSFREVWNGVAGGGEKLRS